MPFIVRPEIGTDAAAIRRVHEQAFGGPAEADLVDALRSTEAYIAELSLVAEANGGEVAGHVLFTRLHIEGATEILHTGLALAPVGVLPAHQRQGIGTALMNEGLVRAKGLGEGIVVVLGHPEYYTRFGFVPASRHGITSPFPAPDEAFMVLALEDGALDGVSGHVRYAQPFMEL